MVAKELTLFYERIALVKRNLQDDKAIVANFPLIEFEKPQPLKFPFLFYTLLDPKIGYDWSAFAALSVTTTIAGDVTPVVVTIADAHGKVSKHEFLQNPGTENTWLITLRKTGLDLQCIRLVTVSAQTKNNSEATVKALHLQAPRKEDILLMKAPLEIVPIGSGENLGPARHLQKRAAARTTRTSLVEHEGIGVDSRRTGQMNLAAGVSPHIDMERTRICYDTAVGHSRFFIGSLKPVEILSIAVYRAAFNRAVERTERMLVVSHLERVIAAGGEVQSRVLAVEGKATDIHVRRHRKSRRTAELHGISRSRQLRQRRIAHLPSRKIGEIPISRREQTICRQQRAGQPDCHKTRRYFLSFHLNFFLMVRFHLHIRKSPDANLSELYQNAGGKINYPNGWSDEYCARRRNMRQYGKCAF